MRKKILTAFVVSAAVIAVAWAGVDTPWFDMEHCDFCKHMTKDPKLMDNVTWEQHEIANGIMIITTVKPEFKASYKEATDAMMKLAHDLETGKVDMKDLTLCGSCQYYGKLEEAGAKIEYIFANPCDITLFTSENPEVVDMIKKYGQRNQEEMAKWEAKRAAEREN